MDKKQVTTNTQSKLGLSGGDNSSNSSFNTAATKNIKKHDSQEIWGTLHGYPIVRQTQLLSSVVTLSLAGFLP